MFYVLFHIVQLPCFPGCQLWGTGRQDERLQAEDLPQPGGLLHLQGKVQQVIIAHTMNMTMIIWQWWWGQWGLCWKQILVGVQCGECTQQTDYVPARYLQTRSSSFVSNFLDLIQLSVHWQWEIRGGLHGLLQACRESERRDLQCLCPHCQEVSSSRIHEEHLSDDWIVAGGRSFLVTQERIGLTWSTLGRGLAQRTSSNRRRRRVRCPLRSRTSTSTSTSESRWRRRRERRRSTRYLDTCHRRDHLGVLHIAQRQNSSTTRTGDDRRCAAGWFTWADWGRPCWTNASTNHARRLESMTWPWARLLRWLLCSPPPPPPHRCSRPPPPPPPLHFHLPLLLPPSKAWLRRNSKPSRYLAPLSSALGLRLNW